MLHQRGTTTWLGDKARNINYKCPKAEVGRLWTHKGLLLWSVGGVCEIEGWKSPCVRGYFERCPINVAYFIKTLPKVLCAARADAREKNSTLGHSICHGLWPRISTKQKNKDLKVKQIIHQDIKLYLNDLSDNVDIFFPSHWCVWWGLEALKALMAEMLISYLIKRTE